MSDPKMMDVDFLAIGGGPAGQKAAIQAAKSGASVLMVEREALIGGECVHRGTIPSKSLRERAMVMQRFSAFGSDADSPDNAPREPLAVHKLLSEVHSIVDAHAAYMAQQLERNGIVQFHGRASFRSPHEVDILRPSGERFQVIAKKILIATGSVPRLPDNVPVDHEHVLDSDSILSLPYLPESMIVLGGGVIATEYASIMALLGVRVTMVDSRERPLTFMDKELVDRFLRLFHARGGTFVGNRSVVDVSFDGIDKVRVALDDGTTLQADKVLSALGRVARLRGLNVHKAGIEVSDRGVIVADDFGRTSVDHIYAAGDVVGPPSLASASMEQGRRAARHAMGLDTTSAPAVIPNGIYSIPEMASVGITEAEAREQYGDNILVGRAEFAEIARGQIAGSQLGLLKLLTDGDGYVIGVHAVGDGATELVHLGQMAMVSRGHVSIFVEHVFNFPTLAESYRVAALGITAQLGAAGLGAGTKSGLVDPLAVGRCPDG